LKKLNPHLTPLRNYIHIWPHGRRQHTRRRWYTCRIQNKWRRTYCPLRIVLPLQKVGAVLYGAEHGIRLC
jgi:hypothetical protein